jgi:hypothetical protein
MNSVAVGLVLVLERTGADVFEGDAVTSMVSFVGCNVGVSDGVNVDPVSVQEDSIHTIESEIKKLRIITLLRHNGFELSGRGIPDRYLFYPLTSYNFAMKSRSIPGPFQRIVRHRKKELLNARSTIMINR